MHHYGSEFKVVKNSQTEWFLRLIKLILVHVHISPLEGDSDSVTKLIIYFKSKEDVYNLSLKIWFT